MAQNRVDPMQQNMFNRQMLLASGIPMIKRLPVSRSTPGSSLQIPLQRMGILTGVVLDIRVTLDVAAGPATASQFGPFNLVNKIKYTDFAGVDRINTSGYALWALNCLKNTEVAGGAIPYALAAADARDTTILSQPLVDGGVLRFQLYVPMAYDPFTDLRGAVLAQTVVGEHYLTLDFGALQSTDSLVAPYTAGTVTADGQITVEAFQMYIQQQSNDINMLPAVDLSMVYAIEGNYVDTSNISAGSPKFLNFPNNRSILSAIHIFENGNAGTANGTDLSQITLLANSNTNLREMSPPLLRGTMRSLVGADLANGVYYISARRQPIATQLMGNVQAKMDVVTVAGAGVVQFNSQYESFYPSGAPLPGIQVN